MADYRDGNWHAATLGQFVGQLIDAGTDVAVVFRVVKDSEPDETGAFTRLLEVKVVPNGQVLQSLEGCETIHKTLAALIQAGIVY